MFAVLLWIGLLHHGIPWPMPEHTLDRTTAGCQLTKNTLEDGTSWWHTYAWMDFPNEHWKKNLSHRPGDEHAKALKDCADWLSALEAEDKREVKAK